MPAPRNPYRERFADGGEVFTGSLNYSPLAPLASVPPHERGPGLTAEHLNSVALSSHAAGYARARLDMEQLLTDAKEERAQAYDEGYDAASDALVRQFAGVVRGRLLSGPWFPLVAASQGKKMRENATAAKDALREAEQWLQGVAAGDEPGL